MHLRSGFVVLAVAGLLGPFAAHAGAPPISPDVPVDGPARAPALQQQGTAATAFGNGIYLSVWQETDGLSAQPHALYATCSDAAGKLRAPDAPPVVVATGKDVSFPAVSYDGQHFLVTWVVPGPGSNGPDIQGVYFDSQCKAGQPFPIAATALVENNQATAGGLDGNNMPVSIVTWVSYDSNARAYQIRYSLLDGAGDFLKDGKGKAIDNVLLSTNKPLPWGSPVAAYRPAVAFGGGVFYVAWSEGNASFATIMASAITAKGVATAPARVDTNPLKPVTMKVNGMDVTANVPQVFCTLPTVASDGKNFFVAWSDDRDAVGEQLTIYDRVMAADGTPLVDDALVVIPAASNAIGPQATFTGGAFVMAWESSDAGGNVDQVRTVYAMRLDGDGVPVDADGVPLDDQDASLGGDEHRACISGDGKSAMLAWGRNSFINHGVTGDDVFLLPIDVTKTPVAAPSEPLHLEPSLQRGHALATNGTAFLMVWEDDRNFLKSGLDIYGLRFDGKGAPIDTDGMGHAKPFVICDEPGDQFMPAVAPLAGGAGTFLVVWSDARNVSFDDFVGATDVYGKRIESKGATDTDGTGFLVSTANPNGNGNPRSGGRVAASVAGNKDSWLVAWEDWRVVNSNVPYQDIYAAVVGVDKNAKPIVGAEQRVTDSGGKLTQVSCQPSAAWNGAHFFVAYEQPCSENPQPLNLDQRMLAHVFGQWFDGAGTLEPGQITVAQTANLDEKTVQLVAADGNRLLAVWRGSDFKGGTDQILGAVLADHTMKAPAVVQLDGGGIGLREAPAISWSTTAGRGLLTWIDGNPEPPATSGVVAIRVDAALGALDSAPFNLVAGVDPLFHVAASPQAGQQWNARTTGADLAVYPRVTPTAAVAAMASGEVLVGYSLLESLETRKIPRMHLRTLGLAPRGVDCSDKSQCGDGICTSRHKCCDTECEGTCRDCNANGCVAKPDTDVRCGSGGVISCGALSTTCRTYQNLPAGQCVLFGQCAEPGSLAECAQYTDAPPGTDCNSAACIGGAGSCRDGVCECTDMSGPAEPHPWPEGGCAVGGPPASGGAGVMLAALVLALVTRRRRRAA